MDYKHIEFLVALVLPFALAGLIRAHFIKWRVWGLSLAAAGVTLLLRSHLMVGSGNTEMEVFLSQMFYRDTLSDFLSLFYTVSVLMTMWMMPKSERKPELLSQTLCALSLITIVFHAENLFVLVGAWLFSLVLFAKPLGGYGRYFVSQVVSVFLFLLALWLNRNGLPTFTTSSWIQMESSLVPAQSILWVTLLIFLSGSLRQGLFPFHAILKNVASQCRFPVLLIFTTANVGLYVIVRYGLPYFDILSSELRQGFVLWILGAFLFLSISVLAINNLRKFFLALMSIQSFLILNGYLQAESLGEAGALIQWVVALLAGTGFGLCVWLFESRTGIRRINKSTVCFEKMPRLAVLFFVFGMGVVDFPGTLGFVSEDLLVHSILKGSLLKGMIVLAAMACTSIAVYRCYMTLFLGRTLGGNELKIDLVRREAFAFLALLVFLVGLGLYPAPITDRAAKAAFHEPAPEDFFQQSSAFSN